MSATIMPDYIFYSKPREGGKAPFRHFVKHQCAKINRRYKKEVINFELEIMEDDYQAMLDYFRDLERDFYDDYPYDLEA